MDVIAGRGETSPAFGPMHPVGLTDPRRGRWPFAVVQLRQDNLAAGQLAGVEGYAGNIASGLVAGITAAYTIQGKPPMALPLTTLTGALLHYIVHAELADFQPTEAMFGLLPKPEDGVRRSKRERFVYYLERALRDLERDLDPFPAAG